MAGRFYRHKIWKGFFHFFLFTSIFIAFCAVGMVFQTYRLFNLPQHNTFLNFVFCGTLCSYNLHWYLTYPGPKRDLSLKTKWNLKYKNLHLVIAAIALIVSGYFFFGLYQHWFWLFVSAGFTFLYTAPKLPFQPFISLRKIARAKTLFLALAWTHITVSLPLLITNLHWTTVHYLFLLNRFLLIYPICVLFDLRDREKDKQEGIRSLITLLDEKANAQLFWAMMLLFFGSAAWLLHFFSTKTVIALTIPGLIVGAFFNQFKNSKSDYTYYFLLDGLMAFSLPLLLIFQFWNI